MSSVTSAIMLGPTPCHAMPLASYLPIRVHFKSLMLPSSTARLVSIVQLTEESFRLRDSNTSSMSVSV